MDEVYVIYYNGKMLDQIGRKTVYLTKKSAKQVITSEAKHQAKSEVFNTHQDWHIPTKEEKQNLINKYKSKYELKTFTESN